MINHTITLQAFIEENTPEGMEFDKENSTLDNIVYKKKEMSTRWENLGYISGHYINAWCEARYAEAIAVITGQENLYATREQAEASIAQAKLSQIMKKVNGDWKPDWDDSEVKYKIEYSSYHEVWGVHEIHYIAGFLAFKSRDIAERVLNENRDLLEQYKPLLGIV